MVPDVARAQRTTLQDWAKAYSLDDAAGASEVSFMLQRAAKQIDVMLGDTPQPDPPEPIEEPRAG